MLLGIKSKVIISHGATGREESPIFFIMEVVALDARLLRDGDGNNMNYTTNSLTLGGGQSADVIVDTTGLAPGSTYFLYTTNLQFLSNNDEERGGIMTEIVIN